MANVFQFNKNVLIFFLLPELTTKCLEGLYMFNRFSELKLPSIKIIIFGGPT